MHRKIGDVIIADRNYYSENFIFELQKQKCDFILRIKKNSHLVKPLLKLPHGEFVTTIRNGKEQMHVRIIKYTIPDPNGMPSEVYICTSLSSRDYDFNFIKNMYGQRWGIETNFYFAKYYLSLNNLKSKKEHTLNFDICMHNFILLFDGIINRMIAFENITNKKNLNKNINISNSITTSITTILKYIFYDDSLLTSDQKIINAIKNISMCVVRKRPNRHNPHIRKRAPPKFTCKGNRFRSLKEKTAKKSIKSAIENNFPKKSINNSVNVINGKSKPIKLDKKMYFNLKEILWF